MKIFTPFVFCGSFFMTFFFGQAVTAYLLFYLNFVCVSAGGEHVEVNLLDNLSSKLTSTSYPE